MGDQQTFSIAVVKGANAGQVLRTERKRISVGAAKDNDIVLADADIAPRHFLVLIDRGRWRIHTLSPDKTITLDRRWSHPETGLRGALVHAAGAELLLFPGDLEEAIIQREIALRDSGNFERPTGSSELVTRIAMSPMEFSSSEIESSMKNRRSAEKPVPSAEDTDPQEVARLSMLPTVAAGRTPLDIREAAKRMLLDERNDSPTPARFAGIREEKTVIDRTLAQAETSIFPRDDLDYGEESSPSAWDRASDYHDTFRIDRPEPKPKIDPPSMLPEVIAAPESQMVRIDRSPNDSDGQKNAWGDSRSPSGRPDRLSTPAPSSRDSSGPAASSRQSQNAWGDRVNRNLPVPVPSDDRPNAWGDPVGTANGNGRSRPLAVHGARALAPSMPGHVISVEELIDRSVDPALAIIRDPDGDFATQVRLLGAKLEDFMRTLGYRAYMMTSPEPLTGKTTAACNLAFALAEDTHRRVALVEANFRYPRIGEIIGAPEGCGLISLLEGRAQISDAVVKLSDRNLVILPAGGTHSNPGELLASPRFKTLIAELANTVDIAVIDAPSVTPFADANLLLPLLDAAVMVVAEGSTRVSWISRAGTQLGMTRIIGALYNRMPKPMLKDLRREVKERMKLSSPRRLAAEDQK
jgi:Mrp family chromosome partitioning ATPase